jgi:hypothetical protein
MCSELSAAILYPLLLLVESGLMLSTSEERMVSRMCEKGEIVFSCTSDQAINGTVNWESREE